MVVNLAQKCNILVNFVPILCELWDDFEKTGLFTWVQYVQYWSFLCQFFVNYGTILKRLGCLIGSKMSYFCQFGANFVRIILRFRKEGVVYLGVICHIFVNFVRIICQFSNHGVVYLGQIRPNLVNFVPILCELFGDFEKRGLFTWV